MWRYLPIHTVHISLIRTVLKMVMRKYPDTEDMVKVCLNCTAHPDTCEMSGVPKKLYCEYVKRFQDKNSNLILAPVLLNDFCGVPSND